ncbi:MAG TPA: histidine kinase dimerization/phospho-acceptor domain-containing protein, partial [Candidatus Dormibacteraeota bacterium]|nr:histidine kinase dimerization/phospho-acceptor domain-containing protein [Candidatus Dormibacteraeota bacterium]
MSLRLRLLLLLAPLFVLGAVAADVSTYTALQSFLVSQLDGQIFANHDNLARGLAGHGFPPGPSTVQRGTFAEILAPDGTVVAGPVNFILSNTDDPSTKPVLPSTLPAESTTQRTYFNAPGTGSFHQYRVFVDPDDFGASGDLLLVAAPLDGVNDTLQHLLWLEIGVTGGVTLVVVIATWLIVRRGLRPLERIAATARVAATDLSTRVQPADDSTEVGRLGLALNSMLAQLEDAFAERQRNEQRLRHFISDASHELRTPLTSMQGYAELIQRAPEMDRNDLLLALRRMEEETQRMGVLVDDLLLLARLDQGRPLQRESVDLEALVADACADARAADPKRIITARIAAPIVVTGDDMRLRQVLGNLMRNALVHTPDGTPIEVALHESDSHAVIDVIDHGRGVSTEHRTRIFERFHRADPELSGDRGGSGLGL